MEFTKAKLIVLVDSGLILFMLCMVLFFMPFIYQMDGPFFALGMGLFTFVPLSIFMAEFQE